MGSYLALLRVGFTLPQTVARCAVRSYRTLSPLPVCPKADVGGLLSAALAVGSRRPGVTWHPALWSPDFPPTLSTVSAIARPTPAQTIKRVQAKRNVHRQLIMQMMAVMKIDIGLVLPRLRLRFRPADSGPAYCDQHVVGKYIGHKLIIGD